MPHVDLNISVEIDNTIRAMLDNTTESFSAIEQSDYEDIIQCERFNTTSECNAYEKGYRAAAKECIELVSGYKCGDY